VLRDVSVGFDRFEWLTRDRLSPEQLAAGATEAMVRAAMDELSLVVRGAVPGAQVRARRGALDLDAVVEIAKKRAAGEITDAEAQAALDLLAGEQPPAEDPPAGESPGGGSPAVTDADLDAALDVALGRSRAH